VSDTELLCFLEQRIMIAGFSSNTGPQLGIEDLLDGRTVLRDIIFGVDTPPAAVLKTKTKPKARATSASPVLNRRARPMQEGLPNELKSMKGRSLSEGALLVPPSSCPVFKTRLTDCWDSGYYFGTSNQHDYLTYSRSYEKSDRIGNTRTPLLLAFHSVEPHHRSSLGMHYGRVKISVHHHETHREIGTLSRKDGGILIKKLADQDRDEACEEFFLLPLSITDHQGFMDRQAIANSAEACIPFDPAVPCALYCMENR
jgi:hypothetical protein